MLIEYFSDTVFPRVSKMGYSAIRTERWKYIQYRDREACDELYDLREDPFELRNRIQDPSAPLATLQEQLAALKRSL